ncbi:MAG: hypothetical protein HQ581_22590, partial [Planctomycetes bacterium]|nr:hypothetical protein [Planctomycetota bacterium]
IPYKALEWMRGRMAGPLAVAMLLPAAVLLGRRATGPQRAGWQYAVLALGLALPVELGCAWLSPNIDAVWLHRSVVVMVSAVAMTLVAGLGLGRCLPQSSDWLDAGRKAAGWFGTLASGMLVVVLVAEAVHYDPVTESTPMALPAVLAVAAALAALMAAAICFAVMPDRDPLGLSEPARALYVYAAEALLGLICVHLRITVPELFQWGFIEKCWPLILMGVAFVGTGLSEWFHRRGLPVLAEPLERTAMLLPLVPGIAFFFIDKAHLGSHPVMLFLIGLFYGLMWVTRRRFAYALLSGAVTQLGVWVLLNRQEGFGFFDHPQLWLIPLALAALVAEHLNRDRLEAAQVTAIRYLALGTIYLSSTFDMFLAGIGESVWLPLVLVGLSVTGVLAGILLRIQSFLYLGVLFLVFVLGTLVWHAAFAEGHKWLLYVCGIAIGVAVITLFAFFEKRRNDVLAALDQFKQWEK